MTATMEADARERQRALEPETSFIVDAPAGSGKTELLTQRFLLLLSRVDQPEQVIAITFTRKAAAEMRRRVVDTLCAARDAVPVAPHRSNAVDFAARVLRRSAQLGWSLLEQAQRLQILTIDALNMSLARQLPILASGIVSIEVTDQPEHLFRLAARSTIEALADIEPVGTGLRRLLREADNSTVRLENWLVSALQHRDRWLRSLVGAGSGDDLPERIETAIGLMRQACIEELGRLAGEALESDLATAMARLAGASVDTATIPAAAAWAGAAGLFLTAKGEWRKRFTRREGLPADDTALRDALSGLLTRLSEVDGLRPQLARLARIPADRLGDKQRELMASLPAVLTRLLAELRIIFAEGQCADHTELALTALEALGAVEAPSELLLALDRRIEHILVDEFQDTSHLQWALLERLTAGWQRGDGRTLFLVGDPMQSIYRFRDADSSLFDRALEQGIGSIDLVPLRLGVNFRSAEEIVGWVNRTFTRVFAEASSTEIAGQLFRTAIAARGTEHEAVVNIDLVPDGNSRDENARVVAAAERAMRADPGQSIGILVRSRSHLIGMRAALAAARLNAHAVEIDSLTDTQFGQDLLAMAGALLHAGDRLSWLGLLRSPYCGLTWHDLHALCVDQPQRSIPDLLSDPERITRMSPDGRARAEWILERLEQGRALRATLSLGRWLRTCWLLVDGPASLISESELARAESFFTTVDTLSRDGDVDDPAMLHAFFSKPDGSEVPAESGIEIMTIHRAKGLEFDTVILPGISRSTRGMASKLLFINDFSLPDKTRVNLMGVAADVNEPITSFLRATEREQETAERARLLYVAATRARRRLHLIGTASASGQLPRAGSLLATLWPGIEADADAIREASGGATTDVGGSHAEFVDLPLEQLSLDRPVPIPDSIEMWQPNPDAVRPEFEWVQPSTVQVGTLIHRELQQLAERAGASGSAVAPRIDKARYRRELALLGVEPPDQAQAAARVADALERVWGDPVGRWILKPRPEAWSELRLTVRENDRLTHLQIDRSFIDEEGRRWIIDYKTGRHLGADIDGFLDSEVERYRPQLARYALALARIDSRPIRLALYFPLMSRMRDWDAPVTRAF